MLDSVNGEYLFQLYNDTHALVVLAVLLRRDAFVLPEHLIEVGLTHETVARGDVHNRILAVAIQLMHNAVDAILLEELREAMPRVPLQETEEGGGAHP